MLNVDDGMSGPGLVPGPWGGRWRALVLIVSGGLLAGWCVVGLATPSGQDPAAWRWPGPGAVRWSGASGGQVLPGVLKDAAPAGQVPPGVPNDAASDGQVLPGVLKDAAPDSQVPPGVLKDAASDGQVPPGVLKDAASDGQVPLGVLKDAASDGQVPLGVLKDAASDGQGLSDDPGHGREEALRAAYAELQEKRRLLQRRLQKLRHQLAGRQLPVERAQAIRERMTAAFSLLHNPLQLGGFRDQQQLRGELRRVDYNDARLQEVEQWLREDQGSALRSPRTRITPLLQAVNRQ